MGDALETNWAVMVAEWRKEQARADGLQEQAHALVGALKVARDEIDGLRADLNLPRDSWVLDLVDAAITAATQPASIEDR